MKNLIVTLSLFCVTFGHTQNIHSKKTLPVYQERQSISGSATAIIPVAFNYSKLQSNSFEKLKKVSIQRIDLIYTVYKSKEEFDQEKLNKTRIENLLKKLPNAKNELIEWNIIGQTRAKDSVSARKEFHGFYIYYHPTPTKESIEKELSYIDSLVFGSITSSVTIKTEYISSNLFLSLDEVHSVGDTSYPRHHYIPLNNNADLSKEFNIVAEVFKRNVDWNKSIVIMDVTGSMSPYIAKTMAWLKASQDSTRISHFVFFNDGDNKNSNQKIIGRTGGIYSSENNAFNKIYKTMRSTMQKGGGGDCPENNIEAILNTLKSNPEAENIIMVADNWATPKDLSLAKQINKPIHVIICGGNYGINLAYIQLAIDTGGTIHTIEEDLDFRKIEPNTQFKLGSYYFTIMNGKIIQAKQKS
jgi:hypothetical protein